MKKIYCYIFTAYLPFVLFAQPKAGFNKILNGSFEKIDQKTKMPVNWNVTAADKGKAEVSSALAVDGKYSIRLTREGTDGHFGIIQENIEKHLTGCKPGEEMILTLRANGGDDLGTLGAKFRFYLEMEKNGKFIGMFSSSPQSIYTGWGICTLQFKMPQKVPDTARLYIQLLTPGNVWIDDVRLYLAKNAVIPKTAAEACFNDFCRAINLPPRHTYTLPEFPHKIHLEFILPDSSLRVILAEIDGKKIKEYHFDNLPVRKQGSLYFELPKLQEGAYELSYFSGKGEEKLYEDDLFRIRKDQKLGVTFDEKRRMFLNGKPFFPIGILNTFLDRDAFRVYSQSGINTVNIPWYAADEELAKYYFGITGKYNLAVFDWNNMADSSRSVDSLRRMFQNFNRIAQKNLPNFIGFFDDETVLRNGKIEKMRRNYKLYFKYTPDYIVWQNHAPRMSAPPKLPAQSYDNIRRASRQYDVIGADIYPVPEGCGHSDLPNQTLSCVGDYTDLVMKAGYSQKPVWMVLQAFGWGEGQSTTNETGKKKRPDRNQLRFMVYNAITHGATGIIWHGEGEGTKDIYSKWWTLMADINLELKAVTDFLIQAESVQFLPQDCGIRILVSKNQDQILVIAVNETKELKSINFKNFLPSVKMFLSPDGRKVELENITQLSPQKVLILCSKRIMIPQTPVFEPEN